MTVTAFGFVDDAGMFTLDDRKGFASAVQKLKGCEVVVTVKKKPTRQGNQSMRYYRGVVVPDVARACGYVDREDWQSVHESLAWKFLRISDHPQFGYPRRRSTSKHDMSQAEMTAYIDQVITYAETTIPDCRIRRPHEVDLDEVWAPDYDEEAA